MLETSDWQHLWAALKPFQALFGLLASIVIGLIGVVATVLTIRWRRLQRRSWIQSERFHSDDYTLKLCQSLSDASPRLRMAAAALLFEKLNKTAPGGRSDRERSAIIQALIAATIGNSQKGNDVVASPELCKFIGDEVVKVLVTDGNQTQIPLYYWQRAQFPNVFWAKINAGGADFFGANFDKASLRRAKLQNAIFREASLVGATLAGAVLNGADFTDADLRGANLGDDDRTKSKEGDIQKTQFDGIRLNGVRYDDKTTFPLGLVLPADARPDTGIATLEVA